MYSIMSGAAFAMKFFANGAAFALGGYLVEEGALEFHNVFK